MTTFLDTEDEEQPNGATVLDDPNQSAVVPNDDVASKRAAKADFALGPYSPGYEKIKHVIGTGFEEGMRRAAAEDENRENEQLRQQMIRSLAVANGGNASADVLEVVNSLTAADLRTDPKTILEKKFSDRYISWVLAQQDEVKEDEFRAAQQAADLTTDIQVLHRRREDYEQKWKDMGWFDTATSLFGQLIPYVPWWRQAQAFQDRPNTGRMTMGGTMEENVSWWWSLPPAERGPALEKALKYYEDNGLVLDGMYFIDSLIGFSSTDKFLADTVSAADFTTGATLWGKLLSKALGRSAQTATKAADTAAEAPKLLTYDAPKLLTYQGSDKYKIQGDLLGPTPEQGSFRFMIQPEHLTPTLESKLPPGRLRATHDPVPREPRYPGRDLLTGRMVGQPRQLDLNLPGAEHQTDIFASGGGRSIEERYAAAGRSRPPEGGYTGSEKAKHLAEPEPIRSAAERNLEARYQAAMAAKGGTRRALADAVQAVANPKAKVEQVLSQNGDIVGSGTLGALKRLANRANVRGLEDVAAELPSFANPFGFYASTKNFGREFAQRAAKIAEQTNDVLLETAKAAGRPVRLPEAALQKGIAQAQTQIRKEYAPTLQNGAIDFEHVPAGANIWNVDTVIGWVGKNDTTLFKSADEANLWARDVYKLTENFRIEPHGSGYKIGVFKHVPETDELVRDALDLDLANKTQGGVVKAFLGRVLGADNILPKFQRANRKIATHAPQEVRRAILNMIERDFYKALNKDERKGVEKVLIENRDGPSKTKPDERGFWYDRADEFEQAYLRLNGKLPSEKAIVAYDTFRRANDLDYIFRNVAMYRDKARMGAESFRFTFTDEAGSALKSPWFDGVERDGIPWAMGKADQDAGIYVYDAATKKGYYKYKYDFSETARKELDQLIKEGGYKVVQVFSPRKHELSGVAFKKDGGPVKDQINFVISNSWEKAPLSFKQVEYRAGGHSIYPGRWFIAQAQIQTGRKGALTYLGDNNILNVGTEAEAKKWSGRLEELRKMLHKAGGWTPEAAAFMTKNLPYTKTQIDSLFFSNNAPLRLDAPILYKESGRQVIDRHTWLRSRYPNLVDETRNPYDLETMIDKAFLMDRDNVIKTIEETGGLTKLVDAEQLSPYTAMNRAMAQSLRNVWMNDYKLAAAESFLKDFKDVLKPREEQLRAHPLYWIYNPQYVETADTTRVELAKAANRAVIQFLGQPTDLGESLHYINEKLLSTVYTLGGQKAVKAVDLALVRDPVKFFRGVAFHTTMGFFNPVQLFIQMQSLAHVAGVAGIKNGSAGLAAAIIARRLVFNPDHTGFAAKKMKAFGWKAEDFTEMVEGLRSAGVANVGAETVLRDDVFDQKLWQSTVGKWLDKGAMFFEEGERMVRLAAFATAFREYKLATKGAKLDQRGLAAVMERADLLSVNMTRASSASWQQGVLSVPTQFFAFNIRLLEQFLGGRLTRAEKARALATYSTLYGIPVTMGIYTLGTSPIPGVPTSYEDIMKEAQKRGIDMSPAYLQALHSGLLSLLVDYGASAVAGERKRYNTAERWGPGASTAVGNLLREDKSYMEILLGASGSILKDAVRSTNPLLYAAKSVFDKTEGDYPVVPLDGLNVLRNIRSVDLAARSYDVIKYGEWVTKTGTRVTKGVDGVDVAMSIAGLSPSQVTDTYRKIEADRENTERQKPYAKDALDNFRLGVQAAARGETDLAMKHWQRARTAMDMGDFRLADRHRILQEGLRQNRTLEEKIDWQFFLKAPASQAEDRMNAFIRKQQ